jgi:hypothetical protein
MEFLGEASGVKPASTGLGTVHASFADTPTAAWSGGARAAAWLGGAHHLLIRLDRFAVTRFQAALI